MEIELLRGWLMWCTIINGSLLIIWTFIIVAAPGMVYQTQRPWFPLSKQKFQLVMYGALGLFKILFLIFNLVPYLALLIIG